MVLFSNELKVKQDGKVTVTLGERSYPINITRLISTNGAFGPLTAGQRAMIVTNETLAIISIR